MFTIFKIHTRGRKNVEVYAMNNLAKILFSLSADFVNTVFAKKSLTAHIKMPSVKHLV